MRAIHVDELNFEEGSTVPGLAFLALGGDSCLDLPVSREGIESFDWHVHAGHVLLSVG